MYLNYLTENAYDRLWDNVENNSELYSSDEPWIESFFAGEEYFKTSKSVNVGAFVPSYVPGKKTNAQKSEEDLTNTILLYEAFKGLTPLQASNKYMWTYLCHADENCRKYIVDRWMTEEQDNTIRKRFFVKGNSDLINDNSLSRLWWYAHLTYDEENDDHYVLTKILLINQTVCSDIMDTLNRMSFVRLKGVLLAIKEFSDLNGKNGLIDVVREANKHMNSRAASTTMETWTDDDIRALYFSFLENAKR